jgi:hypothetical protein
MDIMDDREIQEAEDLKKTSSASKKKFVCQVALLVGAGLLSCFFAFLSKSVHFYILAPLFGLLGVFLLGPIPILLIMIYGLFTGDWLAGLFGIAVCAVCIWHLWKAEKWTGYFGMGVFSTLAVIFFLMSISTGGYPSAEASTIISDLRSMKAASRMYKSDQNNDMSNLSENENHVAVFAPYVDNPGKYTDPDTAYSFRVINGVGWVSYSLGKAKKTRDVYEKLEGKAASVGLLKSPALDVPPVSDDVTHRYTQDAKVVWMRAF